jgi:hypothetical protein
MGRSNPNRKLGSAEIAAVSFDADLIYLCHLFTTTFRMLKEEIHMCTFGYRIHL